MDAARVLVVNAGSSSVKLRVVEPDDSVTLREDLGAPGDGFAEQLASFVERAGPVEVAGHRLVHGGDRFARPVAIDDRARRSLGELSELAPLHNPPALAAVDALARSSPDVLSVACFDTSFHRSLPAAASTYPLPGEWRRRWGLRRYGFHGLSCIWAIRRAAAMLGGELPRRTIVCHLGSGASVTAVVDGCSADTTMGFSPLEGLVMATRPGDLDPGIFSWLLAHGVDRVDIDHALEHRCGLAALAERPSGDMRGLLRAREAGDDLARLAIEVYLHRLVAKIAAMAAAARGIDLLVFTGGVGEGAAQVRSETAERLDWLGVELDAEANSGVVGADEEISAPGGSVRTLVVHAREDLVIAGECRRLLAGQA